MRVQKQMDEIYALFVARVAEGRNLPVEKIKAVAEGRIWSGEQGMERALVDELGGLSRALEVARTLGKLDNRAPVEVVGMQESLLEALLVGDQADADSVTKAVRRVEAQGAVLATVSPELRPFISGLKPLLANETALTLLPFAMVVR